MKVMYDCDVAVIGGGPAGCAAAIAACKKGARSVMLFERDKRLGGVLNQCIHNGFGLTRFKENLTGPEYAYKFIDELKNYPIEVLSDTTVLKFDAQKNITAINAKRGVFDVKTKAVVLAMGCRERSRGALNIAGTRPAGIFSAGAAQRYINIKGYKVGKRIVILGSGDIGLIMARRLTLEGAKVLAVVELMPFSSGLRRNIAQCLNDFDIPLYLSHTITEIEGNERVSGVKISEVGTDRKPIAGTEIHFDCDTVLFSVGLIPENELTVNAGISLSPFTKGASVDQTRETEVDGIFACGNVLHVHDLVDFVSEESELAGGYAAEYALNGKTEKKTIDLSAGENVGYVLPQKIDIGRKTAVKLYFRVKKELKNAEIILRCGENILRRYKKIRVAPGDMENITLPYGELAKLDSLCVEVNGL